MKSCAILIPHVDSMDYLECCVRQIRKHRHPRVEQEIVIVDQSEPMVQDAVQKLYGEDPDIVLILQDRPLIDAGWPIDLGLDATACDYYCSLDCDAFPIHPNWLWIPIRLIEEFEVYQVGSSQGLHLCYPEKGKFFHLNNFFRVMRTDDAQRLSDEAGFLRPENYGSRTCHVPSHHAEWGDDFADNGVVASWYADRHRLGKKVSLRVNEFIGWAEHMGFYGMVVDDLIFHMVYSFTQQQMVDRQKELGERFLGLQEGFFQMGCSEALSRLLSMCQSNPGNRVVPPGEELTEEAMQPFLDSLGDPRIDELDPSRKGLRRQIYLGGARLVDSCGMPEEMDAFIEEMKKT